MDAHFTNTIGVSMLDTLWFSTSQGFNQLSSQINELDHDDKCNFVDSLQQDNCLCQPFHDKVSANMPNLHTNNFS